MAEDTHAPEGEPPNGVFGNLPSSRPGTRSPRRRGSASNGGDTAPATPVPPEAPAEAEPPASSPPAPPPPPRGTRPPGPERIGGVEDLAWAGVAVAARAATLGIRVASRALESVRKPPEQK